MIVQLDVLTEFVDELEHDRQAVAGQRVRTTKLYRRTNAGVTRLSVLATAKVLSSAVGSGGDDYDLIRLEIHVGDLWGHRGRADQGARGRAARARPDRRGGRGLQPRERHVRGGLVKAYQFTLRVPDAGDQAADDRAIAIAERIAEELGATRIMVCELDTLTGESHPISAGSR